SDLSTTFSSTKDSILSTESEQNEISALISTYSIKEDENKYFNKNYFYRFRFLRLKNFDLL
ncbi:MAG: hypothetical protein II432_06535, partial [Erysipelotrichaceae bacterium]|nr:hypothetical protein [Erysipelotrichaceae bacterium]